MTVYIVVSGLKSASYGQGASFDLPEHFWFLRRGRTDTMLEHCKMLLIVSVDVVDVAGLLTKKLLVPERDDAP